ncbi:MAG: RluA family pseudouridine synthase [Bacteroidales bacterium]|nr:RluA family pseudouridine synthase [Bacteroidales bacterium]
MNIAPKKEKQTSLRVKKPMELMDFLKIHFNGKSNTALKALLSRKQVWVNGKNISQHNFLLHTEDQVVINVAVGIYEFHHSKVKIVFEDEFILVIEKTEGLLTVATDGRRDELTAYSILYDYLQQTAPHRRLHIVHRIDRDTSGLLLFAKNKETQLALQDHWHDNVIERTYVAVVEGVPDKEEDTIVSYLRESKAFKIHSGHKAREGKKAITHYQMIGKNDQFAMLKVELETGKKNQIRVHLQDIGHPIVGDRKYGATSSPIGRLGLHAQVLSFVHPVTREEMHFETPIPKKFCDLFSNR